jgi:hypothetical protein
MNLKKRETDLIGRAISELGYRVQHVRNAQDRGGLQGDDPKGVELIFDTYHVCQLPVGELDHGLDKSMELKRGQFLGPPMELLVDETSKEFLRGGLSSINEMVPACIAPFGLPRHYLSSPEEW